MTTERWLPVPGYEGLYSVSDLGNVRAEARTVTFADKRSKNPITRRRKQMNLKPIAGHRGYLYVNLYRDKKPDQFAIHTLVLTAFVGARPEGSEALHYNDIKSNNTLANLRWGTSSENKLDAIRNVRYPWQRSA